MLKRRVQFLWVMWRERFNSVSHVEKKGSIPWVIFLCFEKMWITFKKGSIIWLIFQKKFNSLSQIKKIILWVILKRFYWKMFNSSSHILIRVQFFQSYWKKVQFCDSYSKKKVQFCESNFFFKKKGSILWVISKKGSILSILWVFFQKKKLNSLRHI